MSDWDVDNDYLYNLPPVVLSNFIRVMDTLSNTDWTRFASHVVSNQTELRLVEQRPRRTDDLMNLWGSRNGTVWDLLNILQELQMLRARDIILNWKHKQQSPIVNKPISPPQSDLTHSHPPCFPSFTSPIKEVTKCPLIPENKILPRPGPPPSHLNTERNERIGTQQPTTEQQFSCPVDPASLSTNAMYWSFEEVLRGTENFAEACQIGEGGFGHVYHAKMRKTEYAVKRLKEDSQVGWTVVKESFKTEVEILSQYRHPNILDFAGYSIGENTYCLLYVFMPNGSLEDRLHCKGDAALSWPQRVSVLLGSAKAIQFLHSCSPPLIHGDIKSSNILLGEHLEPKLGDFGLARLCRNPVKTNGKTTSIAQTKTVRGTLAYLPEEYLKDGRLGVEIDVYSFGVVLLEVLTGRRAMEVDSQSKTVYLKDLASELEIGGESFGPGKDSQELAISQAAENILKKHLDPRLWSKGMPLPHGSWKLSQLACRCLHRRRKKRPPMTEVFETLQEVHSGMKTHGRSTVVPVSPDPSHCSTPQPLLSEDPSIDSLASQFSKLVPQEDTYYCPHNTPSLSLPSAISQSDSGPVSESSAGSWDSRCSSSHIPCESDESQGYSQYIVTNPPFHISRSHPSPSREPESESSMFCSGSLPCVSSQANSSSDLPHQQIVVNPVRERLVQKMELYEEGRIPTSDLLSSDISYGTMNARSREPEESDEFASETGHSNRYCTDKSA
ncbi:interleukin-1 receptor-associated kinase 1 [Chanos chanos]|uniref:Interleukin-1 receptor-associated kinase 1 n=1 Tax=Chanos chanos TaxID=29144 RepID=A0A6J2W6V3_CHACN|nr:interleukin-1 receptor-associated kinase 1-like [Chanos chanos]